MAEKQQTDETTIGSEVEAKVAAEATEPQAEAAEPQATVEIPEQPSETALATKEREFEGYKGEITGKVFKLEDLQHIEEETEREPEYEQLMQLVEQTLTNVSEHEIVKGRVAQTRR